MSKFYLADWIIGLAGGILLGNLVLAFADIPWFVWFILFFIVLAVVLFLVILKVRTKRDFILINKVDERLISILDKSARNGLVAIYLLLLGMGFYLEATNKSLVLSTQMMFLAVAASLLVFYASYYSYYFRHN